MTDRSIPSGPPPSAPASFHAHAPALARYTDEVLFSDLWSRTELSPRDRSLVTVAALIALDRVAQLPFHVRRALANGVTRDELGEVIAQLAFYAGWPCAASAVDVLATLSPD